MLRPALFPCVMPTTASFGDVFWAKADVQNEINNEGAGSGAIRVLAVCTPP
jgi:hypothetical protein